MNALQKVRAEIERRKGLLKPQKGQGLILCREMTKQFDFILYFIDSLESDLITPFDTIRQFTDINLVQELRRRGYEVTAEKTIKL